jgi:adenine-specific DNA-methyltransferase
LEVVVPELSEVSAALRQFAGDPQQSGRLAEILGFTPITMPADMLLGAATPLNRYLNPEYGINELYRVGSAAADGGSVGLYIAVLVEWGSRSRDRDKARRRVARALVEQGLPDSRCIVILVPNKLQRRLCEAELVLPRSAAEVKGTATTTISTIRALVNLADPSRFHRDLIKDLAISPGMTLLALSQKWQKTFSVERATRVFYQDYAKVRDFVAAALLPANMNHPVVKSLSKNDAHAWATRQLGRILFLWFLQSKKWLGYNVPSEEEKAHYLLHLYAKSKSSKLQFYKDMLVPLFFEALAKRNPGSELRELLGYTPYLNGGLFRHNRLEDRIHDGGDINLPNDLFDPEKDMSVLGLLSRYRFTTQESTPDDQSVDPDPELLGRVFENLYQGDERHDTGTYYTPREIVYFMCRQTLDGYLCDKAGIGQEALNWIRKQVIEPEEAKSPLAPEVEEKINRALDTLTVCDPAVGSGAFLLGMMNEIVLLRRGLLYAKKHYIDPTEENNFIAQWKRRAITWSLYGVDLNPEAVEICQLRLWLSLVLDLEDPKHVDPLPNLDFRIVAGDSLIDRIAGISFSESLPRGVYQAPLELGKKVATEEQQIDRWRREFEATQENSARLRELRDNISRAQMRIVRYHLESVTSKIKDDIQYRNGIGTKKHELAKLQASLSTMERISSGLTSNTQYQKPFLWPVAFPEVFQNSGFDIVLANPPYVKQEKLAQDDQESYELAFKNVFTGTADILVFFYARALQILKDGGWISFITSNKYMRTSYGEGLRCCLSEQIYLNRIIDFGDLPLFDANGKTVSAYPAVLIGKKELKNDGELCVSDLTSPITELIKSSGRNVNSENVRWALEDLPTLLKRNEFRNYPQVLLTKGGWMLEDPAFVHLFHRLMDMGIPLGELVEGRMYYSIKTGLNKAFVIDKTKRDELIEEDPSSTEMIKSWLRGQDVKRWQVEWPGLYAICIQSSSDDGVKHDWAEAQSEEQAAEIFRENYPAIFDHLKWWERDLRKRADQGRFWWELRSCTYYNEFEKPKIVWGNMAVTSKFAYDESGAFIGAPANILPNPPPWLLPVMNSSLLNFVYPKLTVARGGSFQEFKISYIDSAPIVTPSPEIQKQLSSLMNKIMQCNLNDTQTISKFEMEINDIVYDLYQLKVSERNLISEWVAAGNSNNMELPNIKSDDTDDE